MRSLLHNALDLLAEAEALSVDEMGTSLENAGHKTGRNRNSLRSVLSNLSQEGVVEHAGGGRYRLTRTDWKPTAAQRRVADLVASYLRPEALQNAVIWDATPYLELTEDGAPGLRLVVEHPDAARIAEHLEESFRNESFYAWTWGRTGPLGGLLWAPDKGPHRIDTGVLLVTKLRIGGTALTPHGYRVPFRERIALEFLWMTAAEDIAVPIIDRVLLDRFDLKRAWQAANALGNLADLWALLAARAAKLPPDVYQEFYDRMVPAVQASMEAQS